MTFDEFVKEARKPDDGNIFAPCLFIPCARCSGKLVMETLSKNGTLAFIRCTGCADTYVIDVEQKEEE